MQTLIRPEVNLKIANFENLTHQVKEKSNNAKFSLGYKFYQKLFVILFTLCAFLIFPESPKDSEVLCKKYHSTEACVVW